MTTTKILHIALIAVLLWGCATPPPIPTAFDTSVPATVDAHGLRASVRILPRTEADSTFGAGAGARMRVLELNVENHGSASVSLELKRIRIMASDASQESALSRFSVANLARNTQGPQSTGNGVLDAIQLVFALSTLKRNTDLADSWAYLMPDTLQVAPGKERRMLLAFRTPDWVAGTWRLELPFGADNSAIGPHLSIPLTFKETTRAPG